MISGPTTCCLRNTNSSSDKSRNKIGTAGIILMMETQIYILGCTSGSSQCSSLAQYLSNSVPPSCRACAVHEQVGYLSKHACIFIWAYALVGVFASMVTVVLGGCSPRMWDLWQFP